MKILRWMILGWLLINTVSWAHSRGNPGWQLDSVTYIPLAISYPYHVSSQGTYIADNFVELSFHTTNPPATETVLFYYTGLLPRWWDNTMIYREYERDGWGEPPECVDPDTITFGFYDAHDETIEVFCVNAPSTYTASRPTSAIDTLERYPFDTHTVLVNDRYLVNLPANQWQDLQEIMTTSVNPTPLFNWLAHSRIWWDPQTQHPMARLEIAGEAGEVTGEIANETILLCPMEGDACHALVSIQSHVHGNLADFLISPDGQTLLWSARVFPQDEVVTVGAPIGLIEDIAAFATNVQTGATTEIFRLAPYATGQAKGVHAQWSEDGQTLAIEMRTTGALSGSFSDNGIVLVHFIRSSLLPTATPTPATPAGQSITSFTLVNAAADTDIGPLVDGMTIDLAVTGSSLSVRANTSPATVGSVRFGLDGNPSFRTENGPPYALAGDTSGNYASWTPALGAHTLTATPYTLSGAGGAAGTALTVTFTVVDSGASATSTPSPTATPTLTPSPTPTPSPTSSPTLSPSACGGLSQEAENALLAGSFVTASDPAASGGAYVHVPNGSGDAWAPGSPSRLTFCFTVAAPGDYRLKARVWGTGSDNSDSFYVALAGFTALWDTYPNTAYLLDYVNDRATAADPLVFTLAAGQPPVVVYLREDGARLDTLELEYQGPGMTGVVFRIDAGRTTPYTDTAGQVWSADAYFSGGGMNSLPNPIANTEDDPLYHTERSGNSVHYLLPVAVGVYEVRLHFAEVWFVGGAGRGAPGVGQRAFDVHIEGTLLLDDYDITAAVGPLAADVRIFTVTVSDGTLNINLLDAGPDRPTIAALEVIRLQ